MWIEKWYKARCQWCGRPYEVSLRHCDEDNGFCSTECQQDAKFAGEDEMVLDDEFWEAMQEYAEDQAKGTSAMPELRETVQGVA